MSRAQDREKTFKLVFEFCMTGEKNDITLNEFLASEDTDKTYIMQVYNGVIDQYDLLTEEVASHIRNFALDRIFKVDLAILLLAIYEIKFMKEIPIAVSINEAINLSKTYSTEKSYGYINGVLSNYIKK